MNALNGLKLVASMKNRTLSPVAPALTGNSTASLSRIRLTTHRHQ